MMLHFPDREHREPLKDEGALPRFLLPVGISSLCGAVKTVSAAVPKQHLGGTQNAWCLVSAWQQSFWDPLLRKLTLVPELDCLWVPPTWTFRASAPCAGPSLCPPRGLEGPTPSEVESSFWLLVPLLLSLPPACPASDRLPSGCTAKPLNFAAIQWHEIHLSLKDLNPTQVCPSLVHSLSPRISHEFPYISYFIVAV